MAKFTLLPPAHQLTAHGWSLYTESMDCTEAARHLSAALVKALATCSTGEQVEDLMSPVREQWADYGAGDSEPRNVVRAYANATFAPKGRRYYAIDPAAGLPPYV